MKIRILGLAATLAMLGASAGYAGTETIRVTQLNSDMWQKLKTGEISQLIVEFRQGDVLPLTVNVGGDLLETTDNHPSNLIVRRPFFVKVEQDKVLLSLNGTEYKSIQELLKGNINVGASSEENGGPANAINVLVQAFLK